MLNSDLQQLIKHFKGLPHSSHFVPIGVRILIYSPQNENMRIEHCIYLDFKTSKDDLILLKNVFRVFSVSSGCLIGWPKVHIIKTETITKAPRMRVIFRLKGWSIGW